MTGKIENWELSDGTILAVQEKDMKASKKYGNYQYLFAILMTMFPDVRVHLLESMYCPFKDNDVPLFVRTIMAMQMVLDQYNNVPEFYFDYLYGQAEYGLFYVHTRNNRVYEYVDTYDSIMRELTVNDEAIIRLLNLVTKIKRVEDIIEDEPVVFIEDVTPPILDTAHSTAYFHPNASCDVHACKICEKVTLVVSGIVKPDKPLSEELAPLLTDNPCGKFPSKRFIANASHLFSPVLSFDYNRIRRFGASFTRIDCTDFSARLAELRPSDWYLCRMHWFPPEASPGITC